MPAIAPRVPYPGDFALYLGHAPLGDQRRPLIQNSQHSHPFSLAEPSVKLADRLPHDFALRESQTRGRVLETPDSRFIKRDGHFDCGHTNPYHHTIG
jgi:hypothetical protein